MRSVKDKLMSSRIRLLLEHPFFGQLLMSLELVEMSSELAQYMQAMGLKPTAGVDGSRISYNKKFIDGLTREQCIFVLAHEIGHLFLLHHIRRQSRDSKVWNMACITLDNKIKMWDGTEKLLSEIRPGDFVDSPLGPNEVFGVAFNGRKEVGTLNNSLTCTSTHEILTNEGFKEAENCSNREIYVCAEARDAKSSDATLSNSFSISTCRVDRNKIQGSSGVSSAAGTKSGPIRDQENKHETSLRFEGERSGILWRANRRGGYDNSLSPVSQKTGKDLFTCKSCSYEHFIFSSEVSGDPWILWGTQDQQYGKSVLVDPTKWDGTGRVPKNIGALSDNKETSLQSCDSIVRRAYQAAQERPSDFTYVQTCERSESFELEKGFFQQREGDIQPVFDLITEKGVYIAEGIVVHNCDYVINLMLKECGFHLLSEILIDAKYKDWSTEKVYDHLMQNPEEQPGQGKGNGDEDEGAWNIGGVIDAKNADGSPATKAQAQTMEASLKGKIQNAVTMAKKAGKMPGAVERVIKDILEPKASWLEILQRFVSARAFADYNYGLCHIRQLHQYGVINPVLDSPELGDVNVIVDVSGSIRDEELAQFAGELSDVISHYPGTTINVVYCDTEVQKVDIYEDVGDFHLKAVGGGGTRMKPSFDYIADHFRESSCIILFSDSYLFDWDDIEMPEVPCLMACTSKNVDAETPDWIEVIDIA